MNVEFEKKYLQELFETGQSFDKKHSLKYRLEFTLRQEDDTSVTICNLLEISNHYD